MHILVVDDKKVVRDKVASLLSQLDYSFTDANNGLDAFEKAQKESFDLYIIDHLMPVMNGLQLVKNLKSKDFSSNTPILFMTTQDISTLENHEELKLLNSIITKPIDQELFFKKINSLLIEKSIVHSL
ncbi:MAG: response regulator [Colwelliaceae bacterium]|nr:response regulator [Colwelliaceae bacterium]